MWALCWPPPPPALSPPDLPPLFPPPPDLLLPLPISVVLKYIALEVRSKRRREKLFHLFLTFHPTHTRQSQYKEEMSRRDEDFLDDDDLSDDGVLNHSEEDRSESGGEGYDSDQQLRSSKRSRPNRANTVRPITKDKGKGKGKAWEGQFERTWDQVQEDERGTLEGAVSDIMLTSKTRR